ncbi:MAG: DMT family transporter [Desulfosarcinaceae bacterium]|nr:DMT family transporter [Desulfosarcinaceae bacterium]
MSRSTTTTGPTPSRTPVAAKLMGPLEWGLVLFLSLIWGGSFFFVEVVLVELPPLTVVQGRVTLAAAALLIYLHLGRHRLPSSPRTWGQFALLGLLNNALPFGLIVWGQTHITGGQAAIVNAATPIFSVMLAHFVTRTERLTPHRTAGVLLGWIGVVVLIGLDALKGLHMAAGGQMAVLGAALSYAVAALYGRRFKDLAPQVVAAGMLTCAALLLMPVTLVVDRPWQIMPGPITWTALVALALVSTSLAYIIYFRVLASAGATNILLVTFLIPVSAISLGALFLNERLAGSSVGGMVMILAGLALIDGRLLRFGLRLTDAGSAAPGRASRRRPQAPAQNR